MEAIPRKYGEWGQFDRYCKLVLYHEAIDYLREMKCLINSRFWKWDCSFWYCSEWS